MRNEPIAETGAAPRAFAGPRMVVLAFLIKNLAVGLTYGTFGVLMSRFVERFDARLAVVSLGLPLVVLCSGLLAPAVAWLIQRFSIRAVMLVGALLAATGYAVAAFAGDMVQVLLCYGLLIGPGITLLGLLPCYVLVSNWYVQGQGRAIGIVNMPLMVMIMPLAVTAMLAHLSYVQTMLVLAAGYLAAVPLAALVIDRPILAGQQALGAAPRPSGAPALAAFTAAQLLRRGGFLLLLLGLITTMGPAVATNVHLVALLVERGLDHPRAALMLSVFGGAAALGSLAYGALADRLSPRLALLLNAMSQAVAWSVILAGTSSAALAAAVTVLGAGVGGMMSALSVLLTRLYGPETLARALGLINLVGLPVLFFVAPGTAAVREGSGSYGPAILAYALSLCVAAGCWLIAGRGEPQPRPAAAMT